MNAIRGARHQMAVFSPLPAAALPGAAARTLLGRDPAAWLVEALRSEYHAERVLLTGSGTEALQLAIRAAATAVGGDATVALPAFSCFDVAAAGVAASVRLALYDVDPDTLAPDPASLEAVLQRGARVVVIGPLYGIPVDWAAVERCVARYGAIAIEDAAQGHGATLGGRPLGALGGISVLSFGRGKGWTGSGGGAVLFRRDSARLADAVALRRPGPAGDARVLATALAQCALGRPAVYGLPAAIPWLGLGETHYRPARAPTGMTRASAALLARTQDASRREAGHRREAARAYLEALADNSAVCPVRPAAESEPGYLRFPVRLRCGMAGFASPPRALRLGIAASYPSTLAALPAVRERLDRRADEYPGAERLARTLVSLPTHSRVSRAERAEIVHLLRDYRSDGERAE